MPDKVSASTIQSMRLMKSIWSADRIRRYRIPGSRSPAHTSNSIYRTTAPAPVLRLYSFLFPVRDQRRYEQTGRKPEQQSKGHPFNEFTHYYSYNDCRDNGNIPSPAHQNPFF